MLMVDVVLKLTGSSLMNHDREVGGLDVWTLQVRWAVSPTWNCRLSTAITGPSGGKSEGEIWNYKTPGSADRYCSGFEPTIIIPLVVIFTKQLDNKSVKKIKCLFHLMRREERGERRGVWRTYQWLSCWLTRPRQRRLEWRWPRRGKFQWAWSVPSPARLWRGQRPSSEQRT